MKTLFKKNYLLLPALFLIFAITFTACNSKKVTHVEGTYAAKLPAADCGGINTSIILNNDGTAVKKQQYVDCKEFSAQEVINGKWSLEKDIIKISYDNAPEGEKEDFFLIKDENKIAFLGHDKNNLKESENMPENYILSKGQEIVPLENTATSVSALSIITSNEGKYPAEIKLWDDKTLSDRVKALIKGEYDMMIKNFNVETPIVSDNGIYKTSGCKRNECPAYHTTIIFDAKKDNLNVNIDKNGKVQLFKEKETIEISNTLKEK